MENTVLEKFHQGRQSLGTFSAIGSPLAVESLRYTGLDYVIVDTSTPPPGSNPLRPRSPPPRAQA